MHPYWAAKIFSTFEYLAIKGDCPIMTGMNEWTLADELALQPINLSRVALLCAQSIAYPKLDIARYMAMLQEIAEAARPYVPDNDPTHVRGVLLAEYLFSRERFSGNRRRYNDPRNSFLNDVLERKVGIPITLSILYLDISERFDIPAQGIGLPGHFIVGVTEEGETWYLDPFNGGGRLSINECARLVEVTTGYQGPFQYHWLTPSDPGAITARMLNNLRSAYAQEQQWDQALAVIELLRMVQPDVPEHLRDLGLIHYRKGSTIMAAHYLDSYLQQVPDARDAQTIRDGIAETLDEWARRN
jgi:regulator of sirC expression with transglutaminase-like and TPR domain